MAVAAPQAPPETIFERIVTGWDVEQWVMNHLKKWFSTYLSEVERQHGVAAGTLERPRGWVIAPSFDKWPEDQLPAVVVISIGLADVPRKGGDGKYRARWDIVCGSAFSARTQAESRLGSMFYVSALGTLLGQKPALEVGALAVDWLDEDYTILEFSDERTLSAGAARFQVEFDDVRTTKAGPANPDAPLPGTGPTDPLDTLPYPLWANIGTVEIHVDKKVDDP